MTENTYQQIEIQDESASCQLSMRDNENKENQRAQFTHVAPRITEQQASCRSKPLQEKERIAGKHTHVTLNWLEQLKSSVGCFTSTSLAQDSNDHERISNAV